MAQSPPPRTVLRIADLAQNAPTAFDVAPEPAELTAIAEALELLGLRKVRLSGSIAAQGNRDWMLSARLGATVVQPCVVTLDPVTTRIEAPVERLYQAGYTEPDVAEAEMPEDDRIEPLPAEIDLGALLTEALALNLPAYPRKDGVELAETVVTEPGKTPLSEAEMRPFAGLAALRETLDREDDGER